MGGSDPKPTKAAPVGGIATGQDCPSRISTVVMGPAPGIAKGTWLGVQLDQTGGQPRVVLVDEVTNTTVGSVGGVPNLNVLIRCLSDGVSYQAYVDRVDGGRVDVTVILS